MSPAQPRLPPYLKKRTLTLLSKRFDLPVTQVTNAVGALCAGELMSRAGSLSGIKPWTMHELGAAIGWKPGWRKRDLLKRPRRWRISDREVLRLDALGTPYRMIGARAGVTGEAIRQFLQARGRPKRMPSAAQRRQLRKERERQRQQQVQQARLAKREHRRHWLRTFLTPAIAWYTAGTSYVVIARRLRITPARLGYLIRMFRDGISETTFTRRWITRVTTAEKTQLRAHMAPVRALYAQGQSMADLAQFLGCTPRKAEWLIRRSRRVLGKAWFPPRLSPRDIALAHEEPQIEID